MPLSASIFRRGGPKKELFDVINEEADDEKELDEKLTELNELLHTDKTGRELSAALWRPMLCAAELIKHRKQCARDMGFIWGRRTYLHVEEAVFLVDRGDLLLFIEEPDHLKAGGAVAAGEGQVVEGCGLPAGAAGAAGDAEKMDEGLASEGDEGRRRRFKQRLLSVQEAYDLMVSVGVPLERYLLYSSLCRSGYLVMRHPSRWLLGREERPEQVWGNGAWAACYGGAAGVPGSTPPQAMQQQLVAARAAAAAATAAAAAAGSPATTPGFPSMTAGDASSPMDMDSRVAAVAATAVPIPAAGPESRDSAAPLQPSYEHPEVHHHHHQQRRRRAGDAAPTSGAAVATAAATASRGWWRIAGPDHPHLQGVPEEYFRQLPPAVVEDRLSASLRARLPNLRPFQTIKSVLSSSIAWGAAAPGPAQPSPLPGADATAAHGQFPEEPSRPASSISSRAGASGNGAVASISGVWLGTPGENAHLVFDVYKPGSFVSRYKGQFPAVHTHVAMSSAEPPTLGEMHAADAAAAAAVVEAVAPGALGEAGRPATVTWVSVLNGDIALYSIQQADLLCLM